MGKEKEKSGGEQDKFDILAAARDFVNLLPDYEGDIIEQAEAIAARVELRDLMDRMGDKFAEYLKQYPDLIKGTASVFALPYLDALDTLDDEFEVRMTEADGEDPDRLRDIKREKQLRYNDTALEALGTGVALLRAGNQWSRLPGGEQLTKPSPFEVSTVFINLVSKRLGDQQMAAPIGWDLLVNGMFGVTGVSVDQSIRDTRDYLHGSDE